MHGLMQHLVAVFRSFGSDARVIKMRIEANPRYLFDILLNQKN